MAFHLPSTICDRREASLPRRLVAVKVARALPNMSGSLTKESITLMKLSVVRFLPDLAAALAKVSMMV